MMVSGYDLQTEEKDKKKKKKKRVSQTKSISSAHDALTDFSSWPSLEIRDF